MTYRRGVKHRERLEFKRLTFQMGMDCALCGGSFKSVSDVTVDHIVPVSRGGADEIANWQPMHFKCNQDRFVLNDIAAVKKYRGLIAYKVPLRCPCELPKTEFPTIRIMYVHLMNIHRLGQESAMLWTETAVHQAWRRVAV